MSDGDDQKYLPASALGPAPEGFVWVEFKNAVFLQPVGWYVAIKETVPVPGVLSMDTYATSPTRFSEAEPFETGLTVQVMSGMKTPSWVSAKHAYATYMDGFLKRMKPEDMLLFREQKAGDFDCVIVRFRDTALDLPPIIIHKYAMINSELEMVHVYTFESPEGHWSEQWERYGTPILSRLSMLAPRRIDLERLAM